MNCPFCQVTHSITVPAIHSNGTSAHELFAQVEAATEALARAISALAEAAPNGRDYYIYGGNATAAAVHEHEARMKSLQAVQGDLAVIGAHISECIDYKQRQHGK